MAASRSAGALANQLIVINYDGRYPIQLHWYIGSLIFFLAILQICIPICTLVFDTHLFDVKIYH